MTKECRNDNGSVIPRLDRGIQTLSAEAFKMDSGSGAGMTKARRNDDFGVYLASRPASRSNFLTRIPSSPQQGAAQLLTAFIASASSSSQAEIG